MFKILSSDRTKVSYDRYGSGPPLVLVHGGFSDHISNWEFVKPLFEKQFTVYTIARRGRGETDATEGHSLEDESLDVVSLMEAIGEPVFLLGHSYGAHVALAAALKIPNLVRKLILYEAPDPGLMSNDILTQLEILAQAEEWEQFAFMFFRDALLVSIAELNELSATPFWLPIIADAKASLGDMQALNRYHIDINRFHELRMPVLLQIGSESPRHLYITDALATVLPDVRIEALSGQAHEGMTTAPDLYAATVLCFLAKHGTLGSLGVL